eukprot:1969673-Pyramimonas_sp.AAC.1
MVVVGYCDWWDLNSHQFHQFKTVRTARRALKGPLLALSRNIEHIDQICSGPACEDAVRSSGRSSSCRPQLVIGVGLRAGNEKGLEWPSVEHLKLVEGSMPLTRQIAFMPRHDLMLISQEDLSILIHSLPK